MWVSANGHSNRERIREQGKLARVPQQQQQKHCQLTLLLTVWRRRQRAPHYHFGIRLSVFLLFPKEMLILTIIHAHRELQQQTTTTRKRVRLELLNSTAILCARFHLSLFWWVCIILSRQGASYIFASKKGKEAATAAAKQTTTTHFLSSVLYRQILLLFHIFPAMSVEKSKKEGKRICNTSHILVVWRHSSAKKRENLKIFEQKKAHTLRHKAIKSAMWNLNLFQNPNCARMRRRGVTAKKRRRLMPTNRFKSDTASSSWA